MKMNIEINEKIHNNQRHKYKQTDEWKTFKKMTYFLNFSDWIKDRILALEFEEYPLDLLNTKLWTSYAALRNGGGGAFYSKSSFVNKRMYEQAGDSCPLKSFRLYMSKLHAGLRLSARS